MRSNFASSPADHHVSLAEYVLDLNDHRFSEAVIRQFIGNVCILSVQKFSSNVIEKVNMLRPATERPALILTLNHSVYPSR